MVRLAGNGCLNWIECRALRSGIDNDVITGRTLAGEQRLELIENDEERDVDGESGGVGRAEAAGDEGADCDKRSIRARRG